MTLKKEIEKLVEDHNGIVFTHPAIVYRSTYLGRNILGKNSSFSGDLDERGYVPVEWWIMSSTAAENPQPKEAEGITCLKINQKNVPLTKAVEEAEQLLFGSYYKFWPLIKLLDIGGKKVTSDSLPNKETPPIPPHVHSGTMVDGQLKGPGKLEAYFFPPLDVEPYSLDLESENIVTRLGLKPEITKKQFMESLESFGLSDSMYTLLNEFPVKPYDGWIIPPRTVHSPGPWLTLEIQTPQDDFNLCAWQLGQRLADAERKEKYRDYLLRGVEKNQFIETLLDWQKTTDPKFKENYYKPAKVLESGEWGKRLQIFFDAFYGECIELNPHAKFEKNAEEEPNVGIIWTGEGLVNGQKIDAQNVANREFLVTPKHKLIVENKLPKKIIVFFIYPLRRNFIGTQ